MWPDPSSSSSFASQGGIGLVGDPHDELQGVEAGLDALVGLVDHVLDEEQPPSARTLKAGQLRFDVGDLVARLRLSTAQVDDLHAVLVGAGEDSYHDRLV